MKFGFQEVELSSSGLNVDLKASSPAPVGVKTTRKRSLLEVIRCCARASKRALPHLFSQVSVPALRRDIRIDIYPRNAPLSTITTYGSYWSTLAPPYW